MGAYNTLVEGGVTFFDTAEVYGYQSMKQEMSSEQLLGNFADTNYKYTPMIATKVRRVAAAATSTSLPIHHHPQPIHHSTTHSLTHSTTTSASPATPPQVHAGALGEQAGGWWLPGWSESSRERPRGVAGEDGPLVRRRVPGN